MSYNVEWTLVVYEKCRDEILALDSELRDAVLAELDYLKRIGPNSGRPKVDTVKGSAYSNMKELRFSYKRIPYRYFFAFDPLRQAVVLVGGSKAGDKTFYAKMIALADSRYARHLAKQTEK